MGNETIIDDGVTNPINIATQICMCVLVLCAYVLGVFLHTKIIVVSKKDQHNEVKQLQFKDNVIK